MKKLSILSLTALTILLTGCNISNNQPSDYDEDPEVSDYNYFRFSEDSLIVGTNKQDTLILDYEYNNPNHEMDLEFSSSDTSILEFSRPQYGVFKTKAKEGKVTVTCIDKNDVKVAKETIYVVNDISKCEVRYEYVDDVYSLKDKDVVVIACNQENKAMGLTENGGLISSVDVSFSKDNKYLYKGEKEFAKYMLSGKMFDFTFENQEGKYLSAKNTKNLALFSKDKGNSHFEMGYDEDDGKMYLQSTSSILGWMMYNVSKDGFSLYESNEIEHAMYLISLYKEVIVLPN